MMYYVPSHAEATPTVRNVWADETRDRLAAIDAKIRELKSEAETVKSKCNHVFPDGTSTLRVKYDDGGGSNIACYVCNFGIS